MDNQEWQKMMESMANAWTSAPIGGFEELSPVKPIKPTRQTRLAAGLYHTVYYIAYYPLRLAYIVRDAFEDASFDAWERQQ